MWMREREPEWHQPDQGRGSSAAGDPLCEAEQNDSDDRGHGATEPHMPSPRNTTHPSHFSMVVQVCPLTRAPPFDLFLPDLIASFLMKKIYPSR